MDYGKGSGVSGCGGGSVLKIVNDLAKGSKMPTVSKLLERMYWVIPVIYTVCYRLKVYANSFLCISGSFE